LISQLQLIALERKIRVSFISGDVHLAAVGLLKTYAGKTKQLKHGRGEVQPSLDHRWMLNIVSSAIVNTPWVTHFMYIKLLNIDLGHG
jgi:PhoD related phosphatase